MSDHFVHPQALCESKNIGQGTRVWAFAHVMPKAVIGADCNLCDHVFVENDVVLGDRVTIKSGVQVWDGLRVGNDCFLGPNATFTNDKFPRSKVYHAGIPRTTLEDGCSIGANAVVLPGLTIGAKAMVGAGAVVTRDVPPRAIVVGNPARIVGFVDAPPRLESAELPTSSVSGVRLVRTKIGAEAGTDLPFTAKRVALIRDLGERGAWSGKVRGERFLLCVAGRGVLVVDDGSRCEEIALDPSGVGIHLEPAVRATLYRCSADAVVLVFASEESARS